MIIETDERTLAFVNLHAVLGTIPELVRRVPDARALVEAEPKLTTLGFAVHGGPHATLAFEDGVAAFIPERTSATIRLPFTGPHGFNRVIDGTAQPIPVTGLHRIGFLLRVFAPLTELLTAYLRPDPAALEDPEFRTTSTILTLYVAAAAAAQVANEDRSGRFSAHLIPDGDIALSVSGVLDYTLRVRDHRMEFRPEASANPRSAMVFSDLDTVGGVLSGQLSAMAAICDGRIAMSGMVSMVDNTNRILDRVGIYLGD